jgi:hypothetical protein
MTATKVRPKPHGRPPMPVGMHGTIDVRQVSDRSYEATCAFRDRDGRTRRIARRGSSKGKATARLQEALRDRAAVGTARLLPGSRYEDAARLYMDQLGGQVAKEQLSPTTLDRYRDLFERHLLPRIGQLRLHEIDVAALEDLLEELPVGASAKRQVRTVLRGSLQIALRRRAINTNPARELGQICGAGGKKQPRALMAEERTDLLAKLQTDQYARRCDLPALVMFMLGTGVRIGEALAVRWCDLDLSGMLIAGRRVPSCGSPATSSTSAGRALSAAPARLRRPPAPLPCGSSSSRCCASVGPDGRPTRPLSFPPRASTAGAERTTSSAPGVALASGPLRLGNAPRLQEDRKQRAGTDGTDRAPAR